MSTVTAQLGVVDESASLPAVSGLPTYTAGPPSYLDLTFASAHELVAGLSYITLTTGWTPSGYNGLILPVLSVGSSTTARVMLPSAVGAVTVAGTATKQVYGSGGTHSRFFKILKDGFKNPRSRLESDAIRAGSRVAPVGMFQPVRATGKGPLELLVEQRGFGFWLPHMVGGSITTTSLGSGAYKHTGALGSANGRSFAAQINKPFRHGMPAPFNYVGCKISGWELSMTRGGLLAFKLDVVYQDATIGTLATASFTAGLEPTSYAGSKLEVAGTAVPVRSWSVKFDAGLESDPTRIQQSDLGIEPTHDGDASISVEYEADWTDVALRAYYMATVRSSSYAAHTFTAQWPSVIGGSIYPSLVVSAPAVRLDGDDPDMSGKTVLTQKLTGVVLDPETGSSPFTIEYPTADSTP
ncbi:MAG TPA: phage tail tube protein [Microthrixaceae bacterium]|nr:phage tail tube protein [Microthrixaceae bacterium]